MNLNPAATASPKDLQPNPWNTNHCSPELENRLDASIRRLDMFKPIVVRTLPDGSLQILGGQHRAESAIRVGLEQVPIYNLGQISDQKAKEIGLVDNSRYGSDDSLQLANLLRELGDVSDLGEFMPFSDADFANIFSSTEIDLDMLDIPDDRLEKEVPSTPAPASVQTHQTMRFRVPIEDVENLSAKLEKVMRAQGFTEADSLTNAGDALVFVLNQLEI